MFRINASRRFDRIRTGRKAATSDEKVLELLTLVFAAPEGSYWYTGGSSRDSGAPAVGAQRSASLLAGDSKWPPVVPDAIPTIRAFG